MAVDSIAFHITDRCQLDCLHCLRDPAQKPTDLPLALIEKVLDEVKRVYGTEHVALTGGEPTLYPALAALLDALAARAMKWHLVTNGKRFAQLLALFDEDPRRGELLTAVNFSLDGADEETHDRIRAPGSYREVMTGVTLASMRKIPIVLQMAIHAPNAHQLEAVGLLAGQLGAEMVSFAIGQPTGTARDKDLYLPVRQWQRIKDRIERLQDTLKLRVNMPEGFPVDRPFHVCEPMRSGQLHVDLHGQLNLCCQHSDVPRDGGANDIAGDLNQMSLVEAHRNFLDIVHDAQRARLDAVAAGTLSEWDQLPCNFCLGQFGKPHWSSDGAAGPRADRQRWVGTWAPVQIRVPHK